MSETAIAILAQAGAVAHAVAKAQLALDELEATLYVELGGICFLCGGLVPPPIGRRHWDGMPLHESRGRLDAVAHEVGAGTLPHAVYAYVSGIADQSED